MLLSWHILFLFMTARSDILTDMAYRGGGGAEGQGCKAPRTSQLGSLMIDKVTMCGKAVTQHQIPKVLG